jgi:S-adenosylhomocysteine hydrolase
MKELQLQPLDVDEAFELVTHMCVTKDAYHPIPLENVVRIKSFLNDVQNDNGSNIFLLTYAPGDEIVTNGIITNTSLKETTELAYAQVPLGVIVSGNITVLKDGKGLKNLGEGDFLGLFETSHSLYTTHNRQIGDWTLKAESEVTVLYFGSTLLKQETQNGDGFRRYLIELARQDHVPQPITDLPLLDWVASHTSKSRLHDCAIIAHTHLLPNNRPLFRHLASLLDFGRMYVIDKPYSTVRSTFNELVWAGFEVVPVRMEQNLPYEFAVKKSLDVLWRKVVDDQKRRKFKKLLIIDDGGDVWRTIPWDELTGVQIAVVEQTQRGIAYLENGTVHDHPPIVSVASSGIKKIVESDFIGVSVVKKLSDLGELQRAQRIGIIGMGSIGQAIERELASREIQPYSYDPVYHVNPPLSPNTCPTLDTLFNECDLIIGTTGTDALKGLPWNRVITGKKVLVSASSADLEFASLLKLAPTLPASFDTVSIVVHDSLTVEILNGGYPVNFDREKDTTPDEDIVLTRCLMYIGAMQAMELIDSSTTESVVYNLDTVSQEHLLRRWIEYKKEIGQQSSVTQEQVHEIVNFTSLQGGKEMPTVWN